MPGIKTRGGQPIEAVLAVHPDGTATVRVPDPYRRPWVDDDLFRVNLADLSGPSPDWASNVNRLAHTLRVARSLTGCSCPVARMIATATVKRAVAGLRELTGRPKRSRPTQEV